ncbi:otoraplin [Sorex fumeus]|uniref:otoraplin n=1 Tax=Sorex fumeus TaxID=62283 RepID=UPI0024AD82F6|nr:otoraplin [Sorex fumeus]
MAKQLLLFLLGLLSLGAVHGSFLGKLASKKICADDVCEYTISLARAQKMYEGPDCRFLSFTEGQQIYIYSKLVKEDEEDEEYWAGSVYGQCLPDQMGNMGYFPSNLVEEIQVFKEATKELPTTELDFMCA